MISLFVPFASSWFAIDPPVLTSLTLLKTGTLLGLTIYVRRYHKPWLATVLLTALLLYLDYDARRTAVYLLLHGLIYLALGGALFWAIDRSIHLVVTMALVLAGAAVLLYVL
jgi:hypothetical protein